VGEYGCFPAFGLELGRVVISVDGLSEKDLALLEKIAWQSCSSTARRA